MSDGTHPITRDSLNTSPIDVEDLSGTGAGPERQRIQVTGRQSAAIADVLNTQPTGAEYALPVRQVGSVGAQLKDLTGAQTGTLANPLEGDVVPLNTWQASQLTVGLSAVQVAAIPLSNRRSVTLKAMTSSLQTIYVGASNSVSTSNGFPLANSEGVTLDLSSSAQIWAIATAAAQTLNVIEIGS